MRAQFSFEFVVDVALALVIIGFIVAFFSSITTNNTAAGDMNGICSLIADSVNSVVNSGGLSATVYLPLQNMTAAANYTINVSNGVIIVYAYFNKKIPAKFLSGTNVVSCGANTRATANESFEPANLVLYANYSDVAIGYVYANYSANYYPYFVYVGGFYGKATLYLQYSNGTLLKLMDATSPYIYNANVGLPILTTGEYTLLVEADNNTALSASQSFTLA